MMNILTYFNKVKVIIRKGAKSHFHFRVSRMKCEIVSLILFKIPKNRRLLFKAELTLRPFYELIILKAGAV